MKKRIVCFGEILWDQLPTGSVPGGAPMNAAIRLCALGLEGIVVSAVGQDSWGEELLDFIKQRGATTEYIQRLDDLPTGVVQVSLDSQGAASYDICHPVAWDKIPYQSSMDALIQGADALLFGSLAYRDAVSKATLLKLYDQARFKIFDLNIRKPHFDLEETKYFLRTADFIKLNHEELAELTHMDDTTDQGIALQIQNLLEITGEKSILVSRAASGASFYAEGKIVHHPGFQIEVKDTVGAGDSFLAAFLSKYLCGNSIEEALAYGCAIGSLVASRQGSNPEITPRDIEQLMKSNPL